MPAKLRPSNLGKGLLVSSKGHLLSEVLLSGGDLLGWDRSELLQLRLLHVLQISHSPPELGHLLVLLCLHSTCV